MAGVDRHFRHQRPIRVDAPLGAGEVEAGVDILVLVVAGRGFVAFFPVGALVHIVIAKIQRIIAGGIVRHDAAGAADIEDAATAGAGGGDGGGEQDGGGDDGCGQARGRALRCGRWIGHVSMSLNGL